MYKSLYLFGTSRDKIKMQQKVDADGNVKVKDTTRDNTMTESDVANIIAIGAATGVGAVMLTETDKQRMCIIMTVRTVIPAITSLIANLNLRLPMAVLVIVHSVGDAEAGVVNVDVWGYRNGYRVLLLRLSAFNLWVINGYKIGAGGRLWYGNLLKGDVDIKGDCKVWLKAYRACHRDTCVRRQWSIQLPPPAGPKF